MVLIITHLFLWMLPPLFDFPCWSILISFLSCIYWSDGIQTWKPWSVIWVVVLILSCRNLLYANQTFNLCIVGREVVTPIFYEDPPILPTTLLKFLSKPPPFPVASNLHPHCSFCCLVSLAEWVIAPVMWIYTCWALEP